MEIVGLASAAEWVSAWQRSERGLPRGVAARTAEGLRRCAAISQAQGNLLMAGGYLEAALYISTAADL